MGVKMLKQVTTENRKKEGLAFWKKIDEEQLVIILLIINLFIVLLKKILAISLIYGWMDVVLWAVWIILVVFRSTVKRCVALGITLMLIVICVTNFNDTTYRTFDSPCKTHHILLKGSSTFSLHHPYFSIEVYKSVDSHIIYT